MKRKIILSMVFFIFFLVPVFASTYQRQTPLSLERAKLKRKYIKIISNHTLSHAQKCSLLTDEFWDEGNDELERKINYVLQMNCTKEEIYSKRAR